MSIDFTKLRAAIRDAAEQAFTQVRAAHPDEHFYAFALYTDDDRMTVVPAANSEEAWQRKVSGQAGVSHSLQNYYRWATAEWAYEAAGGEHFQDSQTLLHVPERYEGEDDEDDIEDEDSPEYAVFKSEVIGSMVAALADLDAGGFFGTAEAREQVTLFVSISDSDTAVQTENESARRLNPPAVYQRFVARY